MNIESLISIIHSYGEENLLSKKYAQDTITWIKKYREFAFVKDNLEWHITASLLITNTEKTKVLLMFHKKLQFWLQFWGHCDGEVDVRSVAIREFHEESGITIDPIVYHGIFDIHVHDIPIDRKWTPEHIHHDILFLWSIPEDTPFSRQESEVDDIKWFDIEWIEKYIGEKRMLDMIEKIKTLKNV